MKLSIIIPTLNEASVLGRLIERLITAPSELNEIIVVDGGSTDETIDIANSYNLKVISCVASRAKQMNLGVESAKYNVLYFVHADTLPPITYFEDGLKALSKNYEAACYQSEFVGKWILKLNAFFTQFNWLVSRGGDQSLFITKKCFEACGRYDESFVVMEEYPLIEQLMELQKLYIIPKKIQIDTRKYENRSWLRVSRANYIAFKMYKKGIDSKMIRDAYCKNLG